MKRSTIGSDRDCWDRLGSEWLKWDRILGHRPGTSGELLDQSIKIDSRGTGSGLPGIALQLPEGILGLASIRWSLGLPEELLELLLLWQGLNWDWLLLLGDQGLGWYAGSWPDPDWLGLLW